MLPKDSKPRSTADIAGYNRRDEDDLERHDADEHHDSDDGLTRRNADGGYNVFNLPDQEQTGPRKSAADAFDRPAPSGSSSVLHDEDVEDASYGGERLAEERARPRLVRPEAENVDADLPTGSLAGHGTETGVERGGGGARVGRAAESGFVSRSFPHAGTNDTPAGEAGATRDFESRPISDGDAMTTGTRHQSSRSDPGSGSARQADDRPLETTPGELPASTRAQGTSASGLSAEAGDRSGSFAMTGSGPLLADSEGGQFRRRWEECQSSFVDEPRDAVRGADELVAELMQKLARQFAETRSGLEQQWDRGDDVSTEDLRVALQRYREFFNRLLAA